MSTLQRVMLWFFKTKFSGFQYNREIFFHSEFSCFVRMFQTISEISNRRLTQFVLNWLIYTTIKGEGRGWGGLEGYNHRRRIELEDKAKVVLSDWGTESLPS